MLVIDDNPILCQEEAVCAEGAVKKREIVLIVGEPEDLITRAAWFSICCMIHWEKNGWPG